jgi:hypothetical protein
MDKTPTTEVPAITEPATKKDGEFEFRVLIFHDGEGTYNRKRWATWEAACNHAIHTMNLDPFIPPTEDGYWTIVKLYPDHPVYGKS